MWVENLVRNIPIKLDTMIKLDRNIFKYHAPVDHEMSNVSCVGRKR